MTLALVAVLASLAPFLGAWRCTETLVAAPQTKIESRLQIAPAFDGAWMEMRYEDNSAPPVRGVEYWGWDGKRLVEVGLNSQGARESGVSDGWKDGALVWTGELVMPGDHLTRLRAAFSFDGDRLRNHIELSDGKSWKPFADAVCTRR